MLCRQFRSFQMCWWPLMGDMDRNWSHVGALKRGIIICAVKVLSTNKKPTWDACGYQLSRPSKGLTLGPFSATPHTTMPHPRLPFGSSISPSLHTLDEKTHISQPVSWPHFIHSSALEDKKCHIPLTQQLSHIPENLNPWLHYCGNLEYCNMSYLHKSFLTEMTQMNTALCVL